MSQSTIATFQSQDMWSFRQQTGSQPTRSTIRRRTLTILLPPVRSLRSSLSAMEALRVKHRRLSDIPFSTGRAGGYQCSTSTIEAAQATGDPTGNALTDNGAWLMLTTASTAHDILSRMERWIETVSQ